MPVTKKLTVAACVDVGHPRVLYKAVCHVSKHNTHERKHCPVDHGHHCPTNEQHNVPAIGKPKLHTHKRVKRPKRKKQKLVFVCYRYS